MPLPPNSATLFAPSVQGGSGMPRITLRGGLVLETPHPLWVKHQLMWRWMLDSWEGGETYRMAVYGNDSRQMPVRNLVRHKREYPSSLEPGQYSPQTGRPAGTDAAAQATDDDYEMRRARTPVPAFVSECAESHLDAIYEKEITREGPPDLMEWWEDVDGRGTPADELWSATISPLLLVMGCVDVLVDHPKAPPGVPIESAADSEALGLNGAVASVVLPENMVWWRLHPDGSYAECLVREVGDDGRTCWRHWDDEAWTLYDDRGKVEEPRFDHGYGMVPIVRLFDRRRPRSQHIGLPRYEVIAELQREYYNKDSELVLSDSTAAHPLLQGPDDYVKADGEIPIGPQYLLPMKGNEASGGGKSYQGFQYVDPPKGAADSIRQNLLMIRDAVDRYAKLTKPAGAAGTAGSTVAQSGIAKQIDSDTGCRLLGKLAKALGRAEERVARLALVVMHGPDKGKAEADLVDVSYPGEFNLLNASELAGLLGRVQTLAASGGALPTTEGTVLQRVMRQGIKGLPKDQYAAMDAEIAGHLASNGGPIDEGGDPEDGPPGPPARPNPSGK